MQAPASHVWEPPVPPHLMPAPVPTPVSAPAEPNVPSFVPSHRARPTRQLATRGPRGAVRRMTGGLIRLRAGADERSELDLVTRVRAPVLGYRHVAVLSLKGGSGKTTTAVMMGHTFASYRDDRVAAIDASQDVGTLSYRLAEEPRASVRTLLDQADQMHRYADVRSLSGHAPSRLDIVASNADPTVSRPFDSRDYRRSADILTRFYSLVITDCGAGLMHDAMASVLALAHQIVLVTTASVDGARSADLSLDWLGAHGFADLVRRGVVVVNGVDRHPAVDPVNLRQHFGGRCREVVEIPRDPHLAEGGPTDLARLRPDTRRGYLTLAAAVADGFHPGTA
jgi:MinD-like ATPase involved in chromosome partitioning or flagellar assembly